MAKGITKQQLDNKLNEFRNKFKKELKEEIKDSINELRKTIIDRLTAENMNLLNIINQQSDRLVELERQLYYSQQHSRKSNIEVAGIPNTVEDDDLENTVCNFINSVVEDQIVPEDIEACHRLPSKKTSQSTIVRFVNRKVCDRIHQHKHLLKDRNDEMTTAALIPEGTKIYINYSSCSYYRNLAFNCRQLKRSELVTEIKTGNGKLKIVTNEGETLNISHQLDLTQAFPGYQEFNFD